MIIITFLKYIINREACLSQQNWINESICLIHNFETSSAFAAYTKRDKSSLSDKSIHEWNFLLSLGSDLFYIFGLKG